VHFPQVRVENQIGECVLGDDDEAHSKQAEMRRYGLVVQMHWRLAGNVCRLALNANQIVLAGQDGSIRGVVENTPRLPRTDRESSA
jgi:hypothetical protein